MRLQQFCGDGHICRMRGGQGEVADDPTEGDEQMQFVPKDRLLLGGACAKGRAMRRPLGTGLRGMVQLDHGQAIDNALGVLRDIQHGQDRAAQQGQRILEIAAATIEARATRQVRKEVPMVLPPRDHVGFLVPATPFADQRDRQQFGVTAHGCRARTIKERGERQVQIADQYVHPRAKIGEIGDHQ